MSDLGCREGVWQLSGECLAGVWQVSFGYLEGVLRASGRCLMGVWRESMGCLNCILVSQDCTMVQIRGSGRANFNLKLSYYCLFSGYLDTCIEKF